MQRIQRKKIDEDVVLFFLMIHSFIRCRGMYSIFISTICPVESIIAKDVTFIISAVMRRVDSSCYAGKRKDWYTFLRCGLLISKTQFGKELDEEVESLIKKDRRRVYATTKLQSLFLPNIFAAHIWIRTTSYIL